jgi:hypothetical protein
MSLRHLLANVGIVAAVLRSDLSLAANPALEFFAQLLAGHLFAFVGAAAEQDRTREGERSDEWFHPFTVMVRRFIARKWPGAISDCGIRNAE